MSDSASYLFPPEGRTEVYVGAYFLGRRIDVRALPAERRLSSSPVTLRVGLNGCVVVFRYGAVVFVDVPKHETDEFLTQVRPLVSNPIELPIIEEVYLHVDRSGPEGPEDGSVRLNEATLEKYQLVAEVLAKSVILEHYEQGVTRELDQVEPLAVRLRETGRYRYKGRELLKHIGGTLLSLQNLLGRVEMSEKPDLLWDRPDLERFYRRLAEEYEIRERQIALERKMQLISRTAEAVLNLLQARRSLRVEWYIVLLIVFEIVLTLYQMFLKP